jgi:hypothetical protein
MSFPGFIFVGNCFDWVVEFDVVLKVLEQGFLILLDLED